MSSPIRRLLQRRSFRREVRHALEAGVGLYRTTWQLESPNENGTCHTLAGDVVCWCRDAFGRMHRPYGLDFVTLAIALQNGDGVQTACAGYGSLRPVDFYGPGPAEARIQQTLHDWALSHAFPQSPGGRLSAVLLSWGDLTRDLLLAG